MATLGGCEWTSVALSMPMDDITSLFIELVEDGVTGIEIDTDAVFIWSGDTVLSVHPTPEFMRKEES